MKKETLLNHLKAFDPAVFGLLQDEVQRQRNMLSLVPTVNAMSPLAAYLVGSPLAGSSIESCSARHGNAAEELARTRAAELFNSEHAIARRYRALVQPAQTGTLCGAELSL